MQTFQEALLPQPLFHRLEQMGFMTPTPIQMQAIPPAMEGRDILGSAQTGTGKTGAFGIPLVTRLMTQPRGSALVLLPTRELAVQVMEQLKKFIGSTKIPTALLIGGESMAPQLRQLSARPRLIVGTPGRINDHLARGSLMLHDTQFLVLDETDRMLDMGFGIQLDAIARFLTAKRQTLMFSATMPKNIMALAAKYLTDPIRISVGSTSATAPNITQEQIKLTDDEKFPRLLKELDARTGSVLIFVKTKHGADRMATRLCKQGHKAEALHGDLRQSKRDRVITAFRNQQYRILVATDVAARGLDIPHIEHVINFDLPHSPEDYIHRIGRTARAGAEGDALTLLSPQDGLKWKAIQRLLSEDASGYVAGNEEKPALKSERGGDRKDSGRPQRKRRTYANPGEKSGERSQGSKPQGGKPHYAKAEGKAASGDQPHRSKRPDARKAEGSSENPYQSRRPKAKTDDKPAGEKSYGKRRTYGKPTGDKPQGGKPNGGGRGKGPRSDNARSDKPAAAAGGAGAGKAKPQQWRRRSSAAPKQMAA